MPLRIACPEGHTLIVSQARGGSTLRCPKCGSLVAIPVAAKQPAAADTKVPAIAARGETPSLPAAVLEEPQPPPVVALPQQVVPPPVWSPPPKSRAIVEPSPPPSPPPTPPRSEIPKAEPVPPQPAPPQPVLPPQPATDKLDGPAAPDPVPEPKTEPEPASELPEPPTEALPEPPTEAPPEPPPIEPPVVDSPPILAPASAAAAESTQAPCDLVPSSSQQLTAYVLALSLAAAALFGSGPAVWDVIQYAQEAAGGFIPRWALISLALAGVQIAYAIYFAQLPDWLSGWVVTLVSLAMAALYAGMLGVTLFAGPESFLIRTFEMADALANGRAAMWCLCMTTIMASLAFFAGRTSFRWRQSAGAW